MRRTMSALVAALMITGGVSVAATPAAAASCTRTTKTVVIPLSPARHANLIRHAQVAIDRGYPAVMILQRSGAAKRRTAAVSHTPIKAGYDRDEYPAAVGRKVVRADIAYVPRSENRSGGAILGNKMRGFCDGTRFTYAGIKAKGSTAKPKPVAVRRTDPRFATCTAAKKAGYGPYRRGATEFAWYQDRDRDGVVCE